MRKRLAEMKREGFTRVERKELLCGEENDQKVTTLDQLKTGHRAIIREVEDVGTVSLRLMEMGLTEGEEIESLGTAPWGDPMEFSLRGYRISLRKSEARLISVEL